MTSSSKRRQKSTKTQKESLVWNKTSKYPSKISQPPLMTSNFFHRSNWEQSSKNWLKLVKTEFFTFLAFHLLPQFTKKNSFIKKGKVWVKKMRHIQKLAICNNPHFLSYLHETWWKYSPLEIIIFTRYHDNGAKIADFYLWQIFEHVSFFLLRL